MIGISLAILLQAANPFDRFVVPHTFRLLVGLTSGASTTYDYPTAAQCEIARQRLVALNQHQIAIAQEYDRANPNTVTTPLVVQPICLPL